MAKKKRGWISWVGDPGLPFNQVVSTKSRVKSLMEKIDYMIWANCVPIRMVKLVAEEYDPEREAPRGSRDPEGSVLVQGALSCLNLNVSMVGPSIFHVAEVVLQWSTFAKDSHIRKGQPFHMSVHDCHYACN